MELNVSVCLAQRRQHWLPVPSLHWWSLLVGPACQPCLVHCSSSLGMAMAGSSTVLLQLLSLAVLHWRLQDACCCRRPLRLGPTGHLLLPQALPQHVPRGAASIWLARRCRRLEFAGSCCCSSVPQARVRGLLCCSSSRRGRRRQRGPRGGAVLACNYFVVIW
jgi:hypothetical protein